MTIILTYLKSAFEFLMKYSKFFLLVAVAIILLLLVKQCQSNKAKEKEISQLVNYYTDSLRLERNKNGELEYQKAALITDKKTLEEKNKDLYAELEKEKGNVKTIIKEVIKIVHDTIYLHDTIIKKGDNTYELKWDYTTYFTSDSLNYRKLSGESSLIIDTLQTPPVPISQGTCITQDEIGLSLVTGFQEKNKMLEIFVRSPYPGFQVTKLDGALIDPNESDILKNLYPEAKWSIGPQIGIGITNDLKPGLYIGIGVSYRIFKF